MWKLISVLLIGILLEGSFTTIPVVLDTLVLIYIVKREDLVFLLAFIAGIFLDSLLLKPIGLTSIFFVTSLFIIKIYERKFEINTAYFVTIFSFISSFIFLFLKSSDFIIFQAFASSIFTLIIFLIAKRFTKKLDKRESFLNRL